MLFPFTCKPATKRLNFGEAEDQLPPDYALNDATRISVFHCIPLAPAFAILYPDR